MMQIKQERNMCLVERLNGMTTLGTLRGAPGFSKVPMAKRATFEVLVDANQGATGDTSFTVRDRASGEIRAQAWLVRTGKPSAGIMKLVNKPDDETPFSWEKFGDPNFVPTMLALAFQHIRGLMAEELLTSIMVGHFEPKGVAAPNNQVDFFSIFMRGNWASERENPLYFGPHDLRFLHTSPKSFERYLPTNQGRRFVCLGSSVINTVLHAHREKNQVARVLDLLRDGNVREALVLVKAEGLNQGPIPEFSGREDKRVERHALVLMSNPALLLEILRLSNSEKYATHVWPIQELGSL